LSLDRDDVAGRSKSEITTSKVWDRLSSIDEEAISEAFSKVTDKLEKIKVKTIESKDLSPMISTDSKVVILPSSLLQDPSGLGISLIRWARFLKYDIRLFTVEGTTFADASDLQSEIGLAFWKSLDDITGSVNVQKKKNNATEEVRAFVRAQQIIGYISEVKKLSPEILKRSHRYFGNNPSETVEQQVAAKQFRNIKVQYFKKELENYWREVKWKPQLTTIFITLIRESWRAIDPDILYKNLTMNVLSLDEFVKVYCATPHTEPSKTQRGATETHMRVPSKPKENNMLLKTEQNWLNAINATLFGNTYYETHASEWVSMLLGDGFSETKSYLQALYKARGAYARAFASLTTARLGEIRRHVPDCKSKRKKDVTSKDVATLILLRDDPCASFVQEVVQMDPDLSIFLGCGVLDRIEFISSLPKEERDKTKEILEESLRRGEVYKDIERTATQVETWNLYVKNKSDAFLQRRTLLESYLAALHKEVILKKKPRFERGTIDELIAQSLRPRNKTSSRTPKVSEKKKEKQPAIYIEEPVYTQDEKLASEAAKIKAEARTIKADEFKIPISISKARYEEIYGQQLDRLALDQADEGAPEYRDRVLVPCYNKIKEDRLDVEVYIMSLCYFFEDWTNEAVISAIGNVSGLSDLGMSYLESAIMHYNENRKAGWPSAVFTT